MTNAFLSKALRSLVEARYRRLQMDTRPTDI
jgi:hypothetical protein